MKCHILDTAFVKYLRSLDDEWAAAKHLQECFLKGGKDNMVYELAEHFQCYEPLHLAHIVREKKTDALQ